MNGEQPSLLIPPDLAPVLAAAVEIAISVVALDDTVNLRARADDLAALHRLLTAAAD